MVLFSLPSLHTYTNSFLFTRCVCFVFMCVYLVIAIDLSGVVGQTQYGMPTSAPTAGSASSASNDKGSVSYAFVPLEDDRLSDGPHYVSPQGYDKVSGLMFFCFYSINL